MFESLAIQNIRANLNLCWAHMSDGTCSDIVPQIFVFQSDTFKIIYIIRIMMVSCLHFHYENTPIQIH